MEKLLRHIEIKSRDLLLVKKVPLTKKTGSPHRRYKIKLDLYVGFIYSCIVG